MLPNENVPADVASLVGIFYDDHRRLGNFSEVTPSETPFEYRRLLDHHSHMTVALEKEYGESVDLRVFSVREVGPNYARKIALSRPSDHRVVLFGLVRLNAMLLSDHVMMAIRQESEPLGRVLIRHNVLRVVERLELWRIDPGPELQDVFGVSDEGPIFGRTALIHCDSLPAIELLEIVQVLEPRTSF